MHLIYAVSPQYTIFIIIIIIIIILIVFYFYIRFFSISLQFFIIF